MTNENDPWKYVRADPKSLENNPFVNPKKPEPSPEPPAPQPVPQGSEIVSDGMYVLMDQTGTYALGVHALEDAARSDANSAQPFFVKRNGERIVRPLTFKETIEARVNDYESHSPSDDRLRLYRVWLDSCTGIAYKAGSTKFKIIPECEDLILIEKAFNQPFVQRDYDSLHGIELDSAQAMYGVLLSKGEVLNHPGWRAAVENDLALLRAYADIVFSEPNPRQEAMAFHVRQNTVKDELRALLVDNLSNDSIACGDVSLSSYARFVRKVVPSAGRR